MGKNWRRGKSLDLAVTKNNTKSSDLWKDYHVLGTWSAVARKYGVSSGMAYRVANGYEPRRPHIRHALGLPIYMEAPACPKCGQVHVTKRCTAQKTDAPKRPRRNWKRLALTLAGLIANGRLPR